MTMTFDANKQLLAVRHHCRCRSCLVPLRIAPKPAGRCHTAPMHPSRLLPLAPPATHACPPLSQVGDIYPEAVQLKKGAPWLHPLHAQPCCSLASRRCDPRRPPANTGSLQLFPTTTLLCAPSCA